MLCIDFFGGNVLPFTSQILLIGYEKGERKIEMFVSIMASVKFNIHFS